VSCNGRYVDDAALAPRQHRSPDNGACEKHARQIGVDDAVVFVESEVLGGLQLGRALGIVFDVYSSVLIYFQC
jgi:hypothetical protein